MLSIRLQIEFKKWKPLLSQNDKFSIPSWEELNQQYDTKWQEEKDKFHNQFANQNKVGFGMKNVKFNNLSSTNKYFSSLGNHDDKLKNMKLLVENYL